MSEQTHKLGITPGEWRVEAGTGRVVSMETYDSVACAYADVGEDEADANADLMADAGTTANRTGFLPSELEERYIEAVEACASIVFLASCQRGLEQAKAVLRKAAETDNINKELQKRHQTREGK